MKKRCVCQCPTIDLPIEAWMIIAGFCDATSHSSLARCSRELNVKCGNFLDLFKKMWFERPEGILGHEIEFSTLLNIPRPLSMFQNTLRRFIDSVVSVAQVDNKIGEGSSRNAKRVIDSSNSELTRTPCPVTKDLSNQILDPNNIDQSDSIRIDM